MPRAPLPQRSLVLPPPWTCLVAIAVASIAAAGAKLGAEEGPAAASAPAEGTALRSGKQPGEKVSQFYVRAVTGPLMNKSVCYVCRNGERPVVMVFFRKLEADLPELLQGIDRSIDRNRARGLRGFAVLTDGAHSTAVSRLQTLAFDSKIALPLTVAVSEVETPAGQSLNPEAAVTVVLYRRLEVVGNFAFRPGELNAERIQPILEAVDRLAREPDAPPAE